MASTWPMHLNAAAPLPPLTPIERQAFDYTALEEAMAHLDAVVRQTRRALSTLAAASAPVETSLPSGGLEWHAIID
jgi:hypothetical protein